MIAGEFGFPTHRGVAYLENGRFIPVAAVPGGIVHSIAGDSGGNLWIGDQNQGLFSLDRGECGRSNPLAKMGRKDFASSLFSDPLQGGLWLGFYQGWRGRILRTVRSVRLYASADGLGEGVSPALNSMGTVRSGPQPPRRPKPA